MDGGQTDLVFICIPLFGGEYLECWRGLSRRALFWASEAKRRVRWLAAVKTLYH